MTVKESPVLLVMNARSLATAQHIAERLGACEIKALSGRIEGPYATFEDVTTELRHLFKVGRPIVAFCAAGIVIRSLTALLVDKSVEPPVLAVAQDGSCVVPLLGGHHGANTLARDIARALGVEAAITTAGDLAFGLALDEPPQGYVLANPEAAKSFMAKVLAGAEVRLEGSAPWLAASSLPFGDGASLHLMVSEYVRSAAPDCLHYVPKTLALGVGCERGAEFEELLALAQESLAEAGLSPLAVGGVFSLDLKSDEVAVLALAEYFQVPARFFPAERLEAETGRLVTPSETVFREVGCHGVAEGAGLAAAGPDGELLSPKRKGARTTLAIARAGQPLNAGEIGRGRGSLTVVGLGPGERSWSTQAAGQAIEAAEDLVGYSLYLDLLQELAEGKRRHDFALGEEEARVRHALDLAASGRDVCLISSGDPGIYAMASLVFELLEREGRADWGRIALKVVPGISALQAAAARIGAPLGHDFCAISLSDLLTPWEIIEGRIRAAAEGDFIIAFYNPVSRRRREQFCRAIEILRSCRSEKTPVIVARNLGRSGETVTISELGEITVEEVDMLSIVLVGSSETRRLKRRDGGYWVYTPRGYAVKGLQLSAAPKRKASS